MFEQATWQTASNHYRLQPSSTKGFSLSDEWKPFIIKIKGGGKKKKPSSNKAGFFYLDEASQAAFMWTLYMFPYSSWSFRKSRPYLLYILFPYIFLMILFIFLSQVELKQSFFSLFFFPLGIRYPWIHQCGSGTGQHKRCRQWPLPWNEWEGRTLWLCKYCFHVGSYMLRFWFSC